jgi:hypothetical protein
MKQTTHIHLFANLGSPAEIYKIAFTYLGELQWVKYYEDRALFDAAVKSYKSDDHGYGRSSSKLRLDFLKMESLDGVLGWVPTEQPFTRPQ